MSNKKDPEREKMEKGRTSASVKSEDPVE